MFIRALIKQLMDFGLLGPREGAQETFLPSYPSLTNVAVTTTNAPGVTLVVNFKAFHLEPLQRPQPDRLPWLAYQNVQGYHIARLFQGRGLNAQGEGPRRGWSVLIIL
jgi:hypothetical protein